MYLVIFVRGYPAKPKLSQLLFLLLQALTSNSRVCNRFNKNYKKSIFVICPILASTSRPDRQTRRLYCPKVYFYRQRLNKFVGDRFVNLGKAVRKW